MHRIINQNLECKRVRGKPTNKKYLTGKSLVQNQTRQVTRYLGSSKPKEGLKMRLRSQEIFKLLTVFSSSSFLFLFFSSSFFFFFFVVVDLVCLLCCCSFMMLFCCCALCCCCFCLFCCCCCSHFIPKLLLLLFPPSIQLSYSHSKLMMYFWHSFIPLRLYTYFKLFGHSICNAIKNIKKLFVNKCWSDKRISAAVSCCQRVKWACFCVARHKAGICSIVCPLNMNCNGSN